MQTRVQELAANTFAPYGFVIERPATPAEASGPGWMWWSEIATLATMDRPYTVGYLDLTPEPLRFDWAESHALSSEVIIPVDGDALIYVGTGMETPDWERFEVFRMRPGQAVVLNPGVWHGAPMAIHRPLRALVLLRQGTGTDDVKKATTEPIEVIAPVARI
ncbi:MAG: ureidoglycolate lyase [Chloroflexota bacterium]|nr:ureidoglycolate lyase [Chloroflexota bacterium]